MAAARKLGLIGGMFCVALACLMAGPCSAVGPDPSPDIGSLYRLWDGPTRMENALWGETPKERQFGEGRSKVAIADLRGPGIITMIHFALPQTLKMNRDTILRIYWDGEKNPSVESPLADFFCDPNGALERVESALVNKKRGWNCYFPMPFARSAKIELEYANARYPNGSWSLNPCYSYVMYRPAKSLSNDSGYFHACWRQKTVDLSKEEFQAFEAEGKGQFVGWNLTVRGAKSASDGYPVDENEKFFVDGERKPSIEWQGLEDSFGFSWGFPEQASGFQYTGYQPWYNGAAAYRFCLNDRISFARSIRATIGFGENEIEAWRKIAPQGWLLQFSSVCYWYQQEPHKPFEPMPPAAERRPLFISEQAKAPLDAEDALELRCGSPDGDTQYLADGWDFEFKKGYSFNGSPWTSEIKHCWADFDSLEFDLTCPKGSSGTLRFYILDGDNFAGGRKQSIAVEGRPTGDYEGFQAGRWVEVPISASNTADGRIVVVMKPLVKGSNAVVTYVRFRRVQ